MSTHELAKIDLLNNGFIRLVESMGSDLSVVRAARVSYNAAWRTGKDEGSDTKLIRHLCKHKRTSSFEAVTFTFEVKAPIFILRLLRKASRKSFETHRYLLEQNCPRELDCSILPVNTYYTMFASINLPDIFRFLILRCDSHSQYERRVYANAMKELAKSVAPVCIDAWEKNNINKG